MAKQNLIRSTLVLTIGGFVAKILGALYKIPLTNILGSNGIGLYYMVFPLYNLLFVVSSAGVGISIAKLVAKSQIEHYDSKNYLISGIIISLSLSAFFSILIMLFARQLATLQGNELTYLSFIMIAPALVFSSLLTILKSYFQGLENMIPTTIAMIVEQIIKMVAGLVLSAALFPYGIQYAVMGAVIGVTLSELMALFILVVHYIYHNKKIKNSDLVQPVELVSALKQMVSIAVPNTLLSLIMPLIGLFDSFLVVKLLIGSGFEQGIATSLYGLNNGVVASLIALPSIVTSALSMSMLPNLSGVVNSKEKTCEKISFFIKITWLIALPIFLVFMIMSDDIVLALYNFENVGINEFAFASKLLMLSSVTIIYNALLSTLISIFQALNKSYQVCIILFSGMFLRVILSTILVSNSYINIFGIVISNLCFLVFCVCCCIFVLKKYVPINIKVGKFFVGPISACVISGGCSYAVLRIVSSLNVWIRLFCGGLVLICIYVLFILLLKCFEDFEVQYFPIFKRK